MAPSPFAPTLTFASGGTTGLTLLVDGVGEAPFIDDEAVYPEEGITPAIAIECPDRVVVGVTGHLDTDDGTCVEDFPATLVATTADAVACTRASTPTRCRTV